MCVILSIAIRAFRECGAEGPLLLPEINRQHGSDGCAALQEIVFAVSGHLFGRAEPLQPKG